METLVTFLCSYMYILSLIKHIYNYIHVHVRCISETHTHTHTHSIYPSAVACHDYTKSILLLYNHKLCTYMLHMYIHVGLFVQKYHVYRCPALKGGDGELKIYLTKMNHIGLLLGLPIQDPLQLYTASRHTLHENTCV